MRDLAKEQFEKLGFYVWRGFIKDTAARKLTEDFTASNRFANVFKSEEERNVSSGRGYSKHAAIDRFGVDEIAPSVGKMYADILPVAAHLSGRALIASPYDRSAYYVKRYLPPDGQQGWHFDTNCLSVILYLTDNEDGWTEIRCLDGKTRFVAPEAGALMILDGKNRWHRALPVQSAEKITVILNYYFPDHPARVEHLDSLIFGT